MKRKIKPANINKYAPLVIILLIVGAAAFLLTRNPISEKAAAPSLKIFFFKDGKLSAVDRPLKPAPAPLRQALEALLAGPSRHEESEGMTTQVPAGVKIRRLETTKNIIIVDLSHELGDYGGGSAKVEGIVAQIIFTVTALPGVEKVWLWVDGRRDVVLGGEGFVLDRPLGREDFKN